MGISLVDQADASLAIMHAIASGVIYTTISGVIEISIIIDTIFVWTTITATKHIIIPNTLLVVVSLLITSMTRNTLASLHCLPIEACFALIPALEVVIAHL